MGDITDLKPISPDGELDFSFVADMARFADGTLTEANVRAKYRLDNTVWSRLGDDERLVRAIDDEKIRRIRSGDTKREKAQMLVVSAPDVLSGILLDNSANARHRIDSAKVLNDFASTGAEAAAAATRFEITINLGEDVLKFSKSFEPNADDVDPYHPDDKPIIDNESVVAAIATKKKGDDQW